MQGEWLIASAITVLSIHTQNASISRSQRFQDIEEAHLKQMKEFIMLYIDIVQSNQDMVGQVSLAAAVFAAFLCRLLHLLLCFARSSKWMTHNRHKKY